MLFVPRFQTHSRIVLPRIRSRRGRSRSTKSEGTGLGLSIVRGITADHEGATLDVKTELGRGATFILTMPIAAQSL